MNRKILFALMDCLIDADENFSISIEQKGTPENHEFSNQDHRVLGWFF